MIGAFVVFLVAVAIVTAYIVTVNRFLRTDENWDDPTAVKPPDRIVEEKLHRRLAPARA